jgi:hypothetical protein
VKGKFGIGSAIVLGIFVILGAFVVSKNAPYSEAVGEVVVVEAPPRSAITETDSNSNGTPDWKESLIEKVFEPIETPTSTIFLDPDEAYTPPTTFTGKFTEAFFKDYLEGKIAGEDFSDPTAFVGTAVKAIEKNTVTPRHTQNELTLVPTTDESISLYGNQIAAITEKHSVNNENEARILERAIAEDNPEILTQLVPIRIAYTNMIRDTLHISVPNELGSEHIALLNAYEAILSDIQAMELAFSDPLLALARMNLYQSNADALFIAFKNIASVLDTHNIYYEASDPGAFFYIFQS